MSQLHDMLKNENSRILHLGARNALAALLLLVAAALCCRALAAAPPEKPKPPPFEVSVTAAPSRPRVHVAFNGLAVSADGRSGRNVRREWQEPLMPDFGQPLVFQVSVKSNAGAHRIKVKGVVRDYLDRELAKADFTLAVGAGKTAIEKVVLKAKEADAGPVYFTGTWSQAGGPGKGDFDVRGGIANARLVIEDFERVRYPNPGATIEQSATARHDGGLGVILRPRVPKPPRGHRPAKDQPPVARLSLPLGLSFPGRPLRIGCWIKASAETKVLLHLRDPGIEFMQGIRPDFWVLGPVTVAPGAWRYVSFPAPGYGRPKSKLGPTGQANGAVDYPLIANALEVTCAHGNTVMVDTVDLLNQTEKAAAFRLRLITDKPVSLLYPDDNLRLALANGWLWSKAQKLAYNASFADIAGKEWPLSKGSVVVAPGTEKVLPIALKQLPLGSYRLRAEVWDNRTRLASIDGPRPFVVYRPKAGLLPHHKLHRILRNRHALLADAGFQREIFMLPWHSVDNHPSVENPQGVFTYGWIDPEVKGRRDAGVEVVGRLGFTPLWADPHGSYQASSNVWMGNVYTMPSRTIYWEEYVNRTVAHYRGQINTWVVWDRPDSAVLGSTPQQFTERMLAVAHEAARKANPKVRLVSGGVTRNNLEKFLDGLIEAGAGDYLDGVGILPTTTPLAPEDGYLDVTLARAQRLRRQEKFKPELWALGLGWVTGDGENRVSENDQARYLARAYTICRAYGVKEILFDPDQGAPRDTAGMIFREGHFVGLKPAALAARTARELLAKSSFVREVFLVDRRDGLARAYLFRRPDQTLLLSVWRRTGTSRLALPRHVGVEKVLDVFGNPAGSAARQTLTLHRAPQYVIFKPSDPALLARQLERRPLGYEDATESAWKRNWTCFLDVGDPKDEKALQYRSTKSRLVGPLDSYYHNDYGRHVVDSGRHFSGEESFVVDVSKLAKADMILRKRIDYSVPNQRVKVFCNGKLVGQCFAFKRDRRFRWRNLEYSIPNRFFAGKQSAALRFVAQGGRQATSYAYWIGPLKQKTLYVSDMALLVNSSGYGPGANRDRNILGGEIRFFKGAGKPYAKGLGTNAAASFTSSLIVVPLDKRFKRFRATVGVDVAANGRGTVRFRIGDGTKQLYDSKDMTYYTEPQEIDIDLSDAIVLLLHTGDSGDGNRNDLANWANARLELK